MNYNLIMTEDDLFLMHGSGKDVVRLSESIYDAIVFEPFSNTVSEYLKNARSTCDGHKFSVVTVPSRIFGNHTVHFD